MSRRAAIGHIAGGAALLGLGAAFPGCRLSRGEAGLVSLWHHWDGRNLVLHNALLDRFRAAHPKIRVESTFVHAEFLRRRWLAALKSGALPDLLVINSAWLRVLHADRELRDLMQLAKADELRLQGRLLPRDYDRCLHDQKLLALPLTSAAGGTMLYYNKSVLARAGQATRIAPRNWAEFTELSRLLVARLNIESEGLRVVAWDPFSYSGSQTIVALALGANAPLISRDGRTSLLREQGVQKVFEAFEAYVETVYGPLGGHRALLKWRQRRGAVNVTSPLSPFVAGTQAFTLSGAWLAGNLINATPRPDFDVAAVPGIERMHGGIAANGWAYAMRAEPNDTEAAWELLKYLTVDAEGNGRMAVEAQRPSPIRSVNDSQAYTGMGELWESMRQCMAMDIPYPYSVDSDQLSVFLEEYPFHRLRGMAIAAILQNYHLRLQANLDATAEEGL
jgi:ABC-type glycerol-3-phosphate transport system substrate-binding protein